MGAIGCEPAAKQSWILLYLLMITYRPVAGIVLSPLMVLLNLWQVLPTKQIDSARF